ncbi:hypothetical protein CRG98_045794 [Punica granatum]|uniref:Ionotropic glutamate receptor C-terminal domain-containing protein n=1 Tax=Punica granatum TaxID=22663 RepID=A0A2I0HQS8_PUNGR|nr:hypothetical protein CRG98_045794 [Punica granatum]
MSRSSTLAIFSCIVVLVRNLGGPAMAAEGDLSRKERVKVGLLVDSNAPMGRIASSCINTALSDFYEAHPNYRTRLSLHFRNPQNDVVLAASAVLWPGKTLKEPKGWVMPSLKDTKMKIAVPVKTGFSEFFKIHWDQRTGVPSYSGFSYDMFVAVVDALPFYIPYEFVPFMNASRQSAGTYDEMLYQIKLQVPYRSAIHPTARDIDILKELNKVMTMSTRVFLVHMTATLGSRLFVLANEAGMLNEESVWIVTDGLSSLLDPVGSTAMSSMQGVVGVRPYVPMSKTLKKFMEKQLNSSHGISPSNGTETEPKGWVMPSLKDTKMKIAVPVKTGFSEFFKIHWDQRTGVPSYSGFSYDMFVAVVDALPFYIPYEFVPFMNASRQSAGTYDEMLYQIKLQKVDIVVGDITVVANRSNYVDFTLPYSESGVSMVVAIKDDERRNMWIFLRPLSWDLWLTIGLSFVLTGLIVCFLEGRHQNEDFGGSRREKVVNNRTRLVLAVWIFLLLIITQSYTASLASLLTVERLQPQYVDVQELVRKHHHVGYLKGSYVRELLVRDLGFDESRVIALNSAEEYHEALSNGIGNGGVAAIYDETPYIQLFLGKYCNKYMMVGPRYKNDGFGFAFPRGSPLVSYFSRAILNVTQDKTKMNKIETMIFSG